MQTHRPARARGHAQMGWLETWHTFSFSSYHDPRHMGYRSLRVINDDTIAPARGFGMHPHEDMEILTYVLAGELAHRDSMGRSAVLRPGDVQRMSAGTGIVHSEANPSTTVPVHLLQIWIEPDRQGAPPRYEDRTFAHERRLDRMCLIASPDGRDGSLTLFQDAQVSAALLQPGVRVRHALAPGRGAWVQVALGGVEVNGTSLARGDGLSIEQESLLELTAGDAGAALLLFDLG